MEFPLKKRNNKQI